ncbi:MAG: SIR2 family protein [Frankiaceae bacterium]
MELFTQLLHKQERRPVGNTQVVPIFLNDIGNDLWLLQSIARHAGVPCIIAAGGDKPAYRGVPAPGISQTTAATAIQGAIESAVKRRGGSVEVRMDSGTLTVGVPGAGLPDNPGSRNLLGTVAALLHPELISKPLGIIVMEHDQLDADGRQLLWNMLTVDIPSAGVPLPATLVFAIGGETIDPLYMGRGPGLQFVLRAGDLVPRKEWASNQRSLQGLARKDEPLVLFLGAGASRAARLPMGDELRNLALQSFFQYQSYTAEELPERFFAWIHDNRRVLDSEINMKESEFIRGLTLERVLREMKSPGEGLPDVLQEFAAVERDKRTILTPGLHSLRDFILRRNRLVIVTVNFDRLIETDMPLDHLVPIVLDEDFEQWTGRMPSYLAGTPGPVPLLKLHGDIELPSTIVADVEATAIGLSGAKSECLRTLLGTNTEPRLWAYVGYSMRDPDIIPELTGTGTALALDEYWIDPLGDPNVRLFATNHRQTLWRQHHRADYYQRHITETAESTFQELAEALPRGS